jgi:hypothetical protein
VRASRFTAPPADAPAADAVPPADIPALCRLVGDIPGVDLASLIASLAADPATANQTLRDLVSQAQASAPPETATAPPA